jgi:hypothetical protein
MNARPFLIAGLLEAGLAMSTAVEAANKHTDRCYGCLPP